MYQIKRRQAVLNLLVYCLGYTLIFPLLAMLVLQAIQPAAAASLLPLLEGAIYLITFVFVVGGSFVLLKQDWPVFKQKTRFVLNEVFKHQALMYGLNFVCNLIIMLLTGSEQSNNQDQVIQQLTQNLTLTLFLTLIFAPLVEELVFRASFFSLFYKKNKTLAILLASLAFGLLHVLSSVFTGDWMDCLYLLSYGAMGFCLCRCYIQTKTIWGPISLHLLNNGISVVILLLTI